MQSSVLSVPLVSILDSKVPKGWHLLKNVTRKGRCGMATVNPTGEPLGIHRGHRHLPGPRPPESCWARSDWLQILSLGWAGTLSKPEAPAPGSRNAPPSAAVALQFLGRRHLQLRCGDGPRRARAPDSARWVPRMRG